MRPNASMEVKVINKTGTLVRFALLQHSYMNLKKRCFKEGQILRAMFFK